MYFCNLNFQRATSTGLLCTFANLGGLLPAILGPLMVTDPNSKSTRENLAMDRSIKEEITKYFLICKCANMSGNNYTDPRNNTEIVI